MMPEFLQHEADLAVQSVWAYFAADDMLPADEPRAIEHRYINNVEYFFVAAGAYTANYAGWTSRLASGTWASSGLREPWKEAR